MKKQIKVGIIHSLTGTMSFSESPLIDAAEMAFDEINRSGGVLGAEVLPVAEDCASEFSTYAETTRSLHKHHGISHFFGCWTSASRKAVKPVIEEIDALLWYPVQYEGLEESPNIVYTGSCLNQQVEPAFHWAREHLGSTCCLVGSDYVYPRTANQLIRSLCNEHGVEVLGERYLPLGAENFDRIIDDIRLSKPDVVFSTINGDSNIAFYYCLNHIGIRPEETSVMAFSIGEVELRDIGRNAVGHYACGGYFQCLESEENRSFISRFKDRYGVNRVVSDAVVSAYMQPFLWKNLVEKYKTFNVETLKKHIGGISHDGPAGRMTLHPNHHALKPAMVGRVNQDLQFDIVWQSPEAIRPLPWLGIEETDVSGKEIIKAALAAYPDMVCRPEAGERKSVQRKPLNYYLASRKTAGRSVL